MRLHGNARLTPAGRLLLCRRVIDEHWTVAEASEAAGCSERTGFKWLARFRVEGAAGLFDRSSRPHRIAATPRERVAMIERLRRLRFTGPRIAQTLQMALSTVSVVLKRLGLGRLWRLEPPEPPNRYCRRHPGELIHVDVKKLGRFGKPGHRVTGRQPGVSGTYRAGWEFCHVAIDDTTRLAYVEILDDEKGPTCVALLRRAIGYFAAHGITVECVMTDNGTGYRSQTHRAGIAELGIKHLRTQPYRPRTNGKAERFIQTLQREWAYAVAYETSWQRRRAL